MLKYCLTAGALGVGWFVVLLIPGPTRDWLLDNVVVNMAGLIVVSVFVAVAFRRDISSAESFWQRFARSVYLPLLGAVFFVTLWSAILWIRQWTAGGLFNLHEMFSLYLFAMMSVAIACYVVIPYGMVCMRVMESVLPPEPV